MGRALHTTSASRRALGPVGRTSAPLPTLTLLLTIGSLPLPLADQCTG
ncbi:MAG TPA: hypothetical protein VM032_04395 [Vicinamibacterales bacterium]|nr:hypothetical protein [Vicinamibacterales bacterium]